jgi:hypothetical protein
MSVVSAWSEAINFVPDETGGPSLETVVEHVRSAIIEAGFVSRGRITSGLNEAYRPLGLEEVKTSKMIEAAINLMLLSGDLEEYTTSAGRGYAATPARLIHWDGDLLCVLGASTQGSGTVRQFPASGQLDDFVVRITLLEELGRPEWRDALVELGAADAPDGDPRALFAFSKALAASGDRYSLDEPNAVAVVSGRSEFFGSAEPVLSGRWRGVDATGFYPAAIRAGYATKNVVLHVAGKDTTVWQPPSRDIWRWIVVGHTLAQGDPVLRYDDTNCVLDFLTPPPRQAERAALLSGVRKAPWSWKLDRRAYRLIAQLMGGAS